VLVPRRAIVVEGTSSYVLKPIDGGQPAPDGTPASERVEVQTGLSNNETVEILSGLQPGDQVLLQDVVSTFNPMAN
jgi:multidrug efflux pump subunit AcrA (membrane-fusion protein)